jgi:acyl-CoA synthetase (AMP-forming)/AMP-acid ligase II
VTAAAPETFNFADIWEMVADTVEPEREALVCGAQRRTYAQLEERANRLADHLLGRGVGPGDHVALYLENCPEYLEAMLACFKLRAVPINVNYRYVAGELRYLLENSESVGVLHGPNQADLLGEVADVPRVGWTLCTGDAWEAALAAASSDRPPRGDRSGDDLYILYTGGTTGLPKGVVWRQEDAFFACLGGGDPMRLHGVVTSPAELPDRIVESAPAYFTLAPLMHAAAQWTSFMWLFCGGRVVLLDGSLDGKKVWDTVQAERVSLLTLIGDAVAKPLLDAFDAAGPDHWDLSSLFVISNGGAPLSAGCKARILERFPTALVTDGFGSSEAGVQGTSHVSAADAPVAGGTVRFDQGAKPLLVLDDDNRPVVPGSGVVGRIATGGRLPIGYFNDPEKTAATLVEVDGERWLVTGDLATVAEDGTLDLLGRGSTSINTGGEKVHPEEVEGILHGHPAVADVLVVGVPDERWGSAVTAVVQPAPGTQPTLEDLTAHCRAHLAGYKVPKHVVLVDEVHRSPAGKADYRWAIDTATAQVTQTPTS